MFPSTEGVIENENIQMELILCLKRVPWASIFLVVPIVMEND